MANGDTQVARVVAVYGSALLQGIALILFPAAGPLLTSSALHGLSDGQYGLLFTPQILTAIGASLLAAPLGARWGMKRVLQLGLMADVLAMTLFAASQLTLGQVGVSVAVLMAATGAVGVGFGLTITALNAYAFDLFPGRGDAAVTALHVLTGLGQVGAALVLGAFVELGVWWGAPLSVALAVAVMLVAQSPLRLHLQVTTGGTLGWGRLMGFVAVVFLYGVGEATFGNWSSIYLEQDAGLSMATAGIALSVFWGMVTAGRVVFAVIAARFDGRGLYLVAPVVAGGALLALPLVGGEVLPVALVALGGLGLSFYFPVSVSLATAEDPSQAARISGVLVAAIMLGTGLSANVIGVLRPMVPLGVLFQMAGAAALLMGGIALYLQVTRASLPVKEAYE